MFRTLAIILALVAVAFAAPGYIDYHHAVVAVPVVKHVVPVVPVVKTYTPVVHHTAYVPVVKSYAAYSPVSYGHIYHG